MYEIIDSIRITSLQFIDKYTLLIPISGNNVNSVAQTSETKFIVQVHKYQWHQCHFYSEYGNKRIPLVTRS